MVEAKIQVGLQRGTLSRLGDVLKRLAGRRLRGNFADLRPVIEEAINNGIESQRNGFIPTDDEAGELGIGEGGSLDTTRIDFAWKQLLPSEENITRFSSRKLGTERSNIIGEININIDFNAFLSAPLSVIETDSDIGTIPWMEWFLFGKTIGQTRFSDRRPIPETSRTGRGVMIFGGIWQFPPKNPRAADRIIEEIRLEVIRALRGNRGISILRRRR